MTTIICDGQGIATGLWRILIAIVGGPKLALYCGDMRPSPNVFFLLKKEISFSDFLKYLININIVLYF